MDVKHSVTSIRTLIYPIWSHRIINSVLKGVAIYIGMTLLFGIIYYLTNSLHYVQSIGTKEVNFFESLYFSAITFTTIGYGDIIPNTGLGQIIVFIESCCELTFIAVFGGFLAYKFLQRPNDILLTNNFYIRYRDGRIYLSSRVGNKGKNLIDCTATVELIQIVKNVKRTLYKREISTPLVEMTWYLEIRLDGEENALALQQLKLLFSQPEIGLLRVTVIGYDGSSGNMVHVFKYYTLDKLLFGGKFLDVFTWQGIDRIDLNWANFNKVIPLTVDEQKLIDDLILGAGY
jgi:hypothetical protein